MFFNFQERRRKEYEYTQVRNNVYKLLILVDKFAMSTAVHDGLKLIIKEPYRSDIAILQKMYKAVGNLNFDLFMERYGKDYRRLIAYYS